MAAGDEVVAPPGDGFVVRPSKYRDMQVARVGKRKLFDRRRRKTFLEWFAATGNAVFAAAKAGVHYKTAWKHRMKDPDFRAAFDLAMEQGTVRATARLLEDKAMGPIEIDGDLDAVELVPPDPEAVLSLVARLEAAKAGPALGRRQRTTARIASNAEVEKALAKRLAVFARRQRAMGREGGGAAAAREVRGEEVPGPSGEAGGNTPPPPFGWSPSPSADGEA